MGGLTWTLAAALVVVALLLVAAAASARRREGSGGGENPSNPGIFNAASEEASATALALVDPPEPEPGVQELLPSRECAYSAAVRRGGGERYWLDQHWLRPDARVGACDRDCSNARVQELYESFLIKTLLEDEAVAAAILAVHGKVLAGLRARAPVAFAARVSTYAAAPPNFPVAQKQLPATTPTLKVLQSADFLKHMATDAAVMGEVGEWRDYIFEAVMHRVRGFRTNQRKRRTRDGAAPVENQVGIALVDVPALELAEPGVEPWMHPGRSKCDAESRVLSTYQRNSVERGVPLICGLSGSTNYWVWTALASGADLSEAEVTALLLSAYLTLGADGGHSLQEVASSAALSAILFDRAERYAPESALAAAARASTFAASLYAATADVNPLGYEPLLGGGFGAAHPLDTRMVPADEEATGLKIFGRRYRKHTDAYNHSESIDDKLSREELERFFLRGRRTKAFASYEDVLVGVGSAGVRAREAAVRAVRVYQQRFCE